MLKKSISLILLFDALLGFAQINLENEKEKINLIMKVQEQHWNLGKIEAFMEPYWRSDSLLFIGSKGPTYGWTPTYLNYLKAYPDQESMGQLKFSNIKIDVLNNENAFVVGKWHLTREKGDLEGHYALLWKRIDGQWKIVCDYSASN